MVVVQASVPCCSLYMHIVNKLNVFSGICQSEGEQFIKDIPENAHSKFEQFTSQSMLLMS